MKESVSKVSTASEILAPVSSILHSISIYLFLNKKFPVHVHVSDYQLASLTLQSMAGGLSGETGLRAT